MDIRPYRVSISEAAIATLKSKLEIADFPDELDEAAWDYGAPLADIKRLAQHWRERFDWQAFVDELNEQPHFEVGIPIDGFGELDVHFLHQKSSANRAIPLLFVHGWPGSYIEVTKILKLLKASDGQDVSFHVVAPSLPNYGFSGGVSKKGFGLAQYAETCHKLMHRLGYNKYVTQGGDWGFYITRTLALHYPAYCLASHINMLRCGPPLMTRHPLLFAQHMLTPYTAAEKAGLSRSEWFAKEGSGYRTLQSTKPQTLGYALSDSPVALLAWIYEKLHDWTDDYPWTDDEILTWVSIYAFSKAGPAASLRIYYEAYHDFGYNETREHGTGPGPLVTGKGTTRDRVTRYIGNGVKLGIARFPRELGVPPMKWARALGDVVWESEPGKGGHFAAWECPEAIVNDLRGMFGKGGACEGITEG